MEEGERGFEGEMDGINGSNGGISGFGGASVGGSGEGGAGDGATSVQDVISGEGRAITGTTHSAPPVESLISRAGAGALTGGIPTTPSPDLIQWLLHDDTTFDFPHVSPLDSMVGVSPEFPPPSARPIDAALRHTLVALVPELESMAFSVDWIAWYLEAYWDVFHRQYPIVHRPSFSPHEAHPMLVLAMVMLGAATASITATATATATAQDTPLEPESHTTSRTNHGPGSAVAYAIAVPLRWLIFAHPDCRPPAKVWVVQSLLLLETYEITCSSRQLHERAYLHHGTKIQLLRRLPVLGGDPDKDDDADGAGAGAEAEAGQRTAVFRRWVEAESMKRATLLAFYLDTVNATVYGHQVVLYAHQIKLLLPCRDQLWEFDLSSTGPRPRGAWSDKPPKFLAALRDVLARRPVDTTALGRKVLLAGLVTIMFQMQQKDLELSILEWRRVKESWQETVRAAVDGWRASGAGGDAGTVALYHMAQVSTRISHYDYIIFAGAPSRMNVVAGTTEHEDVARRVGAWARTESGRTAVVHAYLVLWETLLGDPEDNDTPRDPAPGAVAYDPNTDPFFHRKNIVISAVLVIFCYNFSLDGPEASWWDQVAAAGAPATAAEFYPATESGLAYLGRIRRELAAVARQAGAAASLDLVSAHHAIRAYGQFLPAVANKHHLVGLLRLLYQGYRKCRWEIGREYAKLLRNCIERCLGRQKVVCEDMYSGGE